MLQIADIQLFNTLTGPILYRYVSMWNLESLIEGLPPLMPMPEITFHPPKRSAALQKSYLLSLVRYLHLANGPTSDPNDADADTQQDLCPNQDLEMAWYATNRPGSLLPGIEGLRLGGATAALRPLTNMSSSVLISTLGVPRIICNWTSQSISREQPNKPDTEWVNVAHITSVNGIIALEKGSKNIVYIRRPDLLHVPNQRLRLFGLLGPEGEDEEIENALLRLRTSISTTIRPSQAPDTDDLADSNARTSATEDENAGTRLIVYGLIRRERSWTTTMGAAGIKWLYGEDVEGMLEEEEEEKESIEVEQEEERILVRARQMLREVSQIFHSIVPVNNIQLLTRRASRSSPCPCCGMACDDVEI